jgi:adenylate kinase family enzyme
LTRIVETAVGRLGPARRADRTIEILGVAGAGKSTVTTALARHREFETASFIHARRPSDLFLILRSIPGLLPILSAGLRTAPRISWPECKLLVYVSRWGPVLRRRRRRDGSLLLIDQGPLYAMVRLTADRKPYTERPAFATWKDDMLERWATELDVVVWLDAPDDVLWGRINSREKDHQQKGEATEAGRRFITRYRGAFESILRSIEGTGRVRVLRFDTGASTVEQIADALRTSIDPRGGS